MTVFTHPNAVLVSVVAVEVDAVGTAAARAAASSSSSSSDTTSYKRASSSRAGGFRARVLRRADSAARPRAVVRAFSRALAPRADFSLGVVFAFGLAASRTLAGNRRLRAPTGSPTRARAASSAMRAVARARDD